MKKLYLDYLYGYPKKEVYGLANELGSRLTDFLGEDLFCLLLDSRILMLSFKIKKLQCVSDETYKLHPAAKSLEGFLNKVIKGKSLKKSKNDLIGGVFGKEDYLVRIKIKDKRLIAKTKSVWDFCRNDIMHYTENHSSSGYGELSKKYEEIIDIMTNLFTDFYGKTKPDEETTKKFRKYLKIKTIKLKR